MATSVWLLQSCGHGKSNDLISVPRLLTHTWARYLSYNNCTSALMRHERKQHCGLSSLLLAHSQILLYSHMGNALLIGVTRLVSTSLVAPLCPRQKSYTNVHFASWEFHDIHLLQVVVCVRSSHTLVCAIELNTFIETFVSQDALLFSLAPICQNVIYMATNTIRHGKRHTCSHSCQLQFQVQTCTDSFVDVDVRHTCPSL